METTFGTETREDMTKEIRPKPGQGLSLSGTETG